MEQVKDIIMKIASLVCLATLCAPYLYAQEGAGYVATIDKYQQSVREDKREAHLKASVVSKVIYEGKDDIASGWDGDIHKPDATHCYNFYFYATPQDRGQITSRHKWQYRFDLKRRICSHCYRHEELRVVK